MSAPPAPNPLPKPKRGEIWQVQFEPSVGAEMSKARPALVLSRNDAGKLPLRVVVPVTTFQSNLAGVVWLVEVEATTTNGLTHKSLADCFQPRSFALERFISKRGTLDTATVDKIARTVAEVLGVTFD